jgi:hypothetical protein
MGPMGMGPMTGRSRELCGGAGTQAGSRVEGWIGGGGICSSTGSRIVAPRPVARPDPISALDEKEGTRKLCRRS